MTSAPFRIANLVPPSFSAEYAVPKSVVSPGFVSENFDLSQNIAFLNDVDRAISGLFYVDASIRAEAAGYSAAFINTFGDYGLRACRAAVRIPVVGAGQSAMQIAVGLGDEFGILTVWPAADKTAAHQLLRDYGFETRCVGVRHVAEQTELAGIFEGRGLINQMREGRDVAIDRIARAGRDLIAKGADSIVLGCCCMSTAKDALEEKLGCPVVDPLTAGHAFAEMLVTLNVSHRSAQIPAQLTSSVPGMVNNALSTVGDAAAMCGDTCAILSEDA